MGMKWRERRWRMRCAPWRWEGVCYWELMMVVVKETLIVEETPFDKNCSGMPCGWAHFISQPIQASGAITFYREGNCGLLRVTQINSGGYTIRIPAARLEPRERELGTELQGNWLFPGYKRSPNAHIRACHGIFSMFLAVVPSDIGGLARGKTREQEK